MKKLILLFVLIIIVTSCGYEFNKKPEPSKPKLTKEQIQKQEYKQKLEDYNVTFLFEYDSVKVYRFIDHDFGYVVYFTDANGMTRYQCTTKAGRFSRTKHRIQSINTRR